MVPMTPLLAMLAIRNPSDSINIASPKAKHNSTKIQRCYNRVF